MPKRLKVFVFGLASASSFLEALPGWEVEVIVGATAASLAASWDPGVADLLVVEAGEDAAETLGLCRFLVFCSAFSRDSRKETARTLAAPACPSRRADAPLLVLVPAGQERFVRAALKAGAAECLVLPVQADEAARAVTRVRRFPGKKPAAPCSARLPLLSPIRGVQ